MSHNDGNTGSDGLFTSTHLGFRLTHCSQTEKGSVKVSTVVGEVVIVTTLGESGKGNRLYYVTTEII